ncbi:MAG: ribonuclease E/G [Chlamydiae bacterium]|nr:ribonuclease E/G [Chlamydiota bacterium]
MQEILINAESKEIRCAYLKFGKLQDLVIERKKSRQITGNIYRGEVKNILHNIQSAFIDINEEENGFIHINDIIANKKKFEEMFDMDFDTEESQNESLEKDIKKILKIDQPVLVQVVKESIGTKGARLTSNISIAGRYLVLLPNTPHKGVSKKIEDKATRDRLKKLIKAFEMPKDMGLICRTASASATSDMLIQEAHELLNNWQEIVEKFHAATTPTCLFEESDIIKKSIIAAIDKKYDRILVDDYSTFKRCKFIYSKYGEGENLKIDFYRDKAPMFERFNVEKEIERAIKRKVWLPCGGYLYFDKTEAMFTIDVNSGRGSSTSPIKNVEETLVQINLEAAEEIARQLRIRNVGGLIICDFIDMRLRKNQRRVLEKLKTCMKDDSAKCTILGMSEFGLIEMTRQRARESLIQIMFTSCPYCAGTGLIKTFESISIEIERKLKKILNSYPSMNIRLVTHPEVDSYLNFSDKSYYQKLAKISKSDIEFKSKDTLHLNDFEFYCLNSGKKIDA